MSNDSQVDFLEELKGYRACQEGMDWAREQGITCFEEVWNKLERYDWLEWMITVVLRRKIPELDWVEICYFFTESIFEELKKYALFIPEGDIEAKGYLKHLKQCYLKSVDSAFSLRFAYAGQSLIFWMTDYFICILVSCVSPENRKTKEEAYHLLAVLLKKTIPNVFSGNDIHPDKLSQLIADVYASKERRIQLKSSPVDQQQ